MARTAGLVTPGKGANVDGVRFHARRHLWQVIMPEAPVAAATALAAVLSLLWTGRKSMWIDETSSTFYAYDWSEMWHELLHHEANMWLYYLLLHFWLKLGDSAAFLRSLSALFAVATVAMLKTLEAHYRCVAKRGFQYVSVRLFQKSLASNHPGFLPPMPSGDLAEGFRFLADGAASPLSCGAGNGSLAAPAVHPPADKPAREDTTSDDRPFRRRVREQIDLERTGSGWLAFRVERACGAGKPVFRTRQKTREPEEQG